MKTLFTTFTLLFSIICINAQSTIKISDLEAINNVRWKGKLTYKDYQSGKQNTIDATMQSKIIGDKVIYNIQYTYEPQKNHKASIKIKKNGRYFGNEEVVSFSENNGTKTMVTKYIGKDNGKKAEMFNTHILTDSTYSITKEVKYFGTEEKFVRNSYSYTKL